jgi:segregation and condensation protein A
VSEEPKDNPDEPVAETPRTEGAEPPEVSAADQVTAEATAETAEATAETAEATAETAEATAGGGPVTLRSSESTGDEGSADARPPADPSGPPTKPPGLQDDRPADPSSPGGAEAPQDDEAVAGAEAPQDDRPVRVSVPEGMESTLPEDAPVIHLPVFDGPLDLLLYLIRRDKIDIHDIPIAPITREYMAYIDVMRELNLDVAGEFLVMAATLVHIKSKMLVPIEPTEAEGDDEGGDPREELVQRLLEFQRYKEAAGILHQQAQIRAAQWTRPDSTLPKFDDRGEEMIEAGLYDLIAAFRELLERRKTLIAHEVEHEGPPLEECMDQLLAMIREGESLEFLELFAALETKAAMIVTFLAVLELVRLKRVRVYQRGSFGPIRLFRPIGPPAESGPAPVVPA